MVGNCLAVRPKKMAMFDMTLNNYRAVDIFDMESEDGKSDAVGFGGPDYSLQDTIDLCE
jgi:hypothetical protein